MAFFNNSMDTLVGVVETKPVLGKYAPDLDDASTQAGSAASSPAGVEMRTAVPKRTPEVDFRTALQQLDAAFEGPANPTNPASLNFAANQGQPVPVRTRCLDFPEAVMELDGEFLQ
jgi:hypothetical protein